MTPTLTRLHYICIVILIAAGAIAAFFLTQDFDYLRATMSGLLESARATDWSFPLVCGLYILSAAVMFPVIVLNLGTAVVFGPVYGFIYALAGTLIAASLFFTIGRWGREHGLKTMLSRGKLATLDRKLNESGVLGVAVLRLVPMAPFGVFNMAAGITSIGFLDYLAGTFIAFWPGGIARAVVGDSLGEMIAHPTPQTGFYLSAGLCLWAAVVAVLHFGLKKYRNHLAD